MKLILNHDWSPSEKLTSKSTTSSSNGLNKRTTGPDTEVSPRGKSFPSNVWENSYSDLNFLANAKNVSNFSADNSGNTPT